MNYFITKQMPNSWTKQEGLHFLARFKWFFWDEPYFFKYCLDQIIRRCVSDSKFRNILSFCHDQACGSHFSGKKTTAKILQCDFYWPTSFRDAHVYFQSCDRCQRLGKIVRRNEMSLNPILVIEIFDVWSIDFMGPFPTSHGY